MSDITDHGQRCIQTMAAEYGLSLDAVEHMARAVAQGGGTMAQFNVPELGGSGQWMAGGMTMVGDMFNHGLQARVDGLCVSLSNAQAQAPMFVAPQTIAGAAWWPADLGSPASVGGQNQARYAYFPQARRIAFDPGNSSPVILLDTLDHQIGGFSQQQSGPGDHFHGVSFSSQFGQFALSSLPRVGAEGPAMAPEPAWQVDEPIMPDPVQPAPFQQSVPVEAPAAIPNVSDPQQILEAIVQMADLKASGILTEEEFSTKKPNFLARL